MSPAPQDPRPPPLLQTVCQAGLLSLVALMADHVHQLPRPRYQNHALYLHCSATRTCDSKDDGGAGDAEVDSTEVKSDEVNSGKVESAGTKSGQRNPDMVESAEASMPAAPLPDLVPPIAPIYSFDEEGDILPLSAALANHPDDANNPVRRPTHAQTTNDNNNLYQSPSADTQVDDKHLKYADIANTHAADTHTENAHMKHRHVADTHTTDTPMNNTHGTGEHSDTEEVHTPPMESEAWDEETTKAPDSSEGGAGCNNLPRITVHKAKEQVPRIDFHAGSVEAEEDYLEEDQQLRDFCASLLGEAGWGPSRSGGAGQEAAGAGLLTVTPQDPTAAAAAAARKSQQRVPFNTVVFSERKPSTGDALVLSLGLGADGARTIPDIASKNQGAARERLQQGVARDRQGDQQAPTEGRHMRQCESCGVSPDECLKRLGLHSEISSPLPSPKSERVLHFFRQLQGETLARPVPYRCLATSDPEFECSQTPGRPQSRSLASSPILAEDDGRKSRLVAL